MDSLILESQPQHINEQLRYNNTLRKSIEDLYHYSREENSKDDIIYELGKVIFTDKNNDSCYKNVRANLNLVKLHNTKTINDYYIRLNNLFYKYYDFLYNVDCIKEDVDKLHVVVKFKHRNDSDIIENCLLDELIAFLEKCKNITYTDLHRDDDDDGEEINADYFNFDDSDCCDDN